MIAFLAGALYLALCGAAWRLRGGGFVHLGSTQAARLLGACLMAAPLAGWAGDAALLLLVPAFWLGLVVVGWGDFMDMARTAGLSRELASPLVRWLGPATVAHDIAGMSLTMLVVVAPPAAVLAALGLGWWWLAPAALAIGPTYWLAWRLCPARGTEAGEVLAGIALGAGLVAAL